MLNCQRCNRATPHSIASTSQWSIWMYLNLYPFFSFNYKYSVVHVACSVHENNLLLNFRFLETPVPNLTMLFYIGLLILLFDSSLGSTESEKVTGDEPFLGVLDILIIGALAAGFCYWYFVMRKPEEPPAIKKLTVLWVYLLYVTMSIYIFDLVSWICNLCICFSYICKKI